MPGMAPMLSKTYDALRAAGAPDDKTREAAEEIAGFEGPALQRPVSAKHGSWIWSTIGSKPAPSLPPMDTASHTATASASLCRRSHFPT